jgi:hypothetical protein
LGITSIYDEPTWQGEIINGFLLSDNDMPSLLFAQAYHSVQALNTSAPYTQDYSIIDNNSALHGYHNDFKAEEIGSFLVKGTSLLHQDPDVVAPVPEPSTFLLLGAGLGGACLIRRRMKKGERIGVASTH